MTPRIRVLVVDDSALMRKLIPQVLAADAAIEVVGTAMDGSFALKKIEELKPDVITLDLEMPGMDGIAMLRQMLSAPHAHGVGNGAHRERVPVIAFSAHTTQGATTTLKALALGAFDFVAKPREAASQHLAEIGGELIRKIKAAAHSKPAPLLVNAPVSAARVRPAPDARRNATRILAIAASTGGPNALQYLLAQLPADFPAAIAIVQHMPEGFTNMFARRLNEICAIEVKEAQSGDLLLAGRALICPGNRHLRVRKMTFGNTVVLGDDERVAGHRPSADVLFRSVAEAFGSHAAAVIMTGMGDDGADALGEIKNAGGLTIAQSEESCAVFGMPKAAIERGHAVRVVSLEALPRAIQAHCADHGALAAGR